MMQFKPRDESVEAKDVYQRWSVASLGLGIVGDCQELVSRGVFISGLGTSENIAPFGSPHTYSSSR